MMNFQLKLDKTKSFNPESLAKEWNLDMQISKKEQNGLVIIASHAGKRLVFESYLGSNKEMAMKYLKFISDHPYSQYVKWDARKQKFGPAT